MSQSTPISAYTALRRLAPYVRPFRAPLAGSAVAALIATAAGLLVPLVIRAMVDGPIAHGELGALPWLAAGALGLGAVEAGLIYLRRRLVARPTAEIEARLRADLYYHLQRLPVAFHDGWPSGQLLSRASNDLSTLRWFLAFHLIFLVVNGLSVLGGIALLWWLSPLLGAIVAGLAVPLAAMCLVFERRYAVAARRAQDQAGDLATAVEESAQGIRVLKSFGRGRDLARRFARQAGQLRDTELVKIRNVALIWLVIVLLPEISVALLLGIAGSAVAAGTLQLGTLVAVIWLMTYLYWPVASIGWLLAETGAAATAATRYWEVIDAARTVTDPPRPVALPAPVRGAVRLDGVRFGYPGADADVLRGVDLEIRPGETLALVGPTGCGKTTLTALLPRLADVTAGRVSLDGIDVRDLRLADLRTAVATAFEEPVLFSASVRENVALGVVDATDAQVWEALRVARADGFVAGLPWGLDTRIGEQGLSLSGGQRQRLALARAVIGRPAVLVADDPLSALDVQTEAEVEAALRQVLHGVTALVVAHRPSTVRLADRVALLDGGRIQAIGTHEELMETSPAYRALLSGGVSEHDDAYR